MRAVGVRDEEWEMSGLIGEAAELVEDVF